MKILVKRNMKSIAANENHQYYICASCSTEQSNTLEIVFFCKSNAITAAYDFADKPMSDCFDADKTENQVGLDRYKEFCEEVDRYMHTLEPGIIQLVNEHPYKWGARGKDESHYFPFNVTYKDGNASRYKPPFQVRVSKHEIEFRADEGLYNMLPIQVYKNALPAYQTYREAMNEVTDFIDRRVTSERSKYEKKKNKRTTASSYTYGRKIMCSAYDNDYDYLNVLSDWISELLANNGFPNVSSLEPDCLQFILETRQYSRPFIFKQPISDIITDWNDFEDDACDIADSIIEAYAW